MAGPGQSLARLQHAYDDLAAERDAQLRRWYDAVDGFTASAQAQAIDLYDIAGDLMVAGWSAKLMVQHARTMAGQSEFFLQQARNARVNATHSLELIGAGFRDDIPRYYAFLGEEKSAMTAARNAAVDARHPVMSTKLTFALTGVSVLSTGFGIYSDVKFEGESGPQATVSQLGALGAGLLTGAKVGGQIGRVGGPVATVGGIIVGGVVGTIVAIGVDESIDQVLNGDEDQPHAAASGDGHAGDAILTLMTEATTDPRDQAGSP